MSSAESQNAFDFGFGDADDERPSIADALLCVLTYEAAAYGLFDAGARDDMLRVSQGQLSTVLARRRCDFRFSFGLMITCRFFGCWPAKSFPGLYHRPRFCAA